MMRALSYISGAAYSPEENEAILGAFEAAWAQIEHHFQDCPLLIGPARVRLADEILALAERYSREPDELENRALQAMTTHYGFVDASESESIMGPRVHNSRYWRSYVDETVTIAGQMKDPECKRILLGVAESYAQLARHLAAAEAARADKTGPRGGA